MTDTITLPREVVEFVLKHLEWWSDDEPQEKEAIEVLRTALAAEQPKPSEEAEALRRDAERYRWLREWMVRHSILCLEYGDRWALRKPHFISSSVGCGETEDAAIDAAMENKR